MTVETNLFEYIGTSDKLKNAVVTIERETDKSFFINFRPNGGGAAGNLSSFKNQSKTSSKHVGNLA